MPEVSVVIPSYNCARYVAAAVESVLAQTCTDLEILVVDDGSKDDTQDVLRRYGPPVRTFLKPNGGVSSARNLGTSEARGRYVSFLDADDTYAPRKLEAQLAALRANPGYRACFAAFTRVDQDLRPLDVWRSTRGIVALADLLLSGNVISSMCTVLVERALLEQVGGFDLALSQCADWDMWVRLATQTDFLYIDEALVTYRQHGSNMSLNPQLLERDSVAVLTKGFELACLAPALRARRRTAFARNAVVLAGSYFHARRYRDVARCLARAAVLDVRQCGYAAALPLRIASRALSPRLARLS